MARRRVMFLVDFDNVSPDVIEQAFAICMHEYGSVHLRRAYCTAEQALANATFMKKLSLRPIVNLAVGKNSTDIALAVDAIDLAIAERPDVAVIVSSDSDFTPLVGRLREKGCWLRGFGQRGKTGDGVVAAYDQFDELAHRDAPRRAPATKAPARTARPAKAAERPAKSAAPAPVPVAAPVPKPAPVPTPMPAPRPVASPAQATPVPTAAAQTAAKPAAKRTRRKAAEAAPVTAAPAAPVAPPAPAWSAEVEAILVAVPALRSGAKVELGEAAKALRDAGLLAKTAASTRLFKKHAERFVLTPERQPNKVQFNGTASA